MPDNIPPLIHWTVKLQELAEELDKVSPAPSREKALVKTKLDEARLWTCELANKEIP